MSTLLGSIGSLRSSPALRSGAWGIADQGLISATNFATMVLLARMLAPHAFGSFVLAYTLLLFAANLQMSLITRPHNVLAAGLDDAAFASHTASTAVMQALFAGGLALLCCVTAVTASLAGSGAGGLIVALGVAGAGWQMQEFARQVQYTRGLAREAFRLDVVAYGGQIVSLALLWQTGYLHETTALYGFGLALAISALWGFSRLPRPSATLDRSVLQANWRFGRWLLAESLGQWLSSQALPLLTAAIVSVAATGVLKAVQNLVAPAHVVMNAFQAFAVPRSARAFAKGGKAAMLALLVPAAAVALSLLVAYWLLVAVLAAPLLDFVYGDDFAGDAALVWLMVGAYLALFLGQVQSIGLMAVENTRSIFAARVVAILLTFTVGLLLIWRFEIHGAVAAAIVSDTAMVVLLAYQLWRSETPAAVSDASTMSLAAAGGDS